MFLYSDLTRKCHSWVQLGQNTDEGDKIIAANLTDYEVDDIDMKTEGMTFCAPDTIVITEKTSTSTKSIFKNSSKPYHAQYMKQHILITHKTIIRVPDLWYMSVIKLSLTVLSPRVDGEFQRSV